MVGFVVCAVPGRVAARPARAVGQRWRLAVATSALLLGLSFDPRASALDYTRLQQTAVSMGPRAERMVVELKDLLSRTAPLDEALRLERINSFINRQVGFASDQVVWRQEDYWATPLETLSKGEGDCEDYAIAKYFTLLASGVAPGKLRLVYVRAMLPGRAGEPLAQQAHMVLAYYADAAAEPLILDNLVPEVRLASRRTDLTPVFSFNREGLWNGAGPQSAGDPQARVSRWRDVLVRARAEGFE